MRLCGCFEQIVAESSSKGDALWDRCCLQGEIQLLERSQPVIPIGLGHATHRSPQVRCRLVMGERWRVHERNQQPRGFVRAVTAGSVFEKIRRSTRIISAT